MRRRFASIEDLADVHKGYYADSGERMRAGTHRLLTGRNLSSFSINFSDRDDFVLDSGRPSFKRSTLADGDILVAILFDERKLCVFREESVGRAIAGDSLAIIRPRNDEFLRDYLSTSAGRERFLQEAARRTIGAHVSRLRIQDLRRIRVPLLQPSEIQQLAQAQLSLVGNELLALIDRGESTKQEFKATLRKNLRTGQMDTKIEDAVLRTIAAFCNTDGGVMLIGINDDGTVLGIEEDGFPSPDKYSLHLINLIRDRLQPPPLDNVKQRMMHYSGRSICRVDCTPTAREIWLRPRNNTGAPELYVRLGPSSKALLGPEITEYYRSHFRDRPTYDVS